jgi:hypothetical protein
MDKISRAVIPGSRLFSTLFGLLRAGKNITISLGTALKRLPSKCRQLKFAGFNAS